MMLRNILQYGRTVSADRYGFELEVEGRRLPTEGITNWDVKRDGSLNNSGLEYVTRQAFRPDKFETMLGRVDQAFKQNRSELNCTVSCSCHIHMNVQDLTIKDVCKILTAYYCVEDILCDYAGPDRAGNLFCLRLSDTDDALEDFMGAIERNSARELSTLPRYTAVNLNSLSRFGTLEFRAFRGIRDSAMELLDWANIIHSVRVFALSYTDPSDILGDVSLQGPEEFFRRMFPDPHHQELLQPFFSEDRIMEGVRRCQWLAYNVNFDAFGTGRQRGERF